MEEDHKELQLLPATRPTISSSQIPSWPSESPSLRFRSTSSDLYDGPSLDLKLSISLRPIRPPSSRMRPQHRGSNFDDRDNEAGGGGAGGLSTGGSYIETLKWQAAEQIRMAAMEKAYAERVRELTRREMELAQSEFARARHMWERARQVVDRAERMKENSGNRMIVEEEEEEIITCHSCRQKFRA